jgi:uncharacterized protein
MQHPDVESAIHYALERLRSELAPHLVYHSLAHTADDVLIAAAHLAEQCQLSGEERNLLRVAASFHDLGFVVQSEEHEQIGAQIAAAVLPSFGFAPQQITQIVGIILATRMPHQPHTLLEQIIADADLDVLGRDDFLIRNRLLRQELEAQGGRFSDEQWYTGQLRFMQQHQYFTAAARKWREAGKQRNIAAMRALQAR